MNSKFPLLTLIFILSITAFFLLFKTNYVNSNTPEKQYLPPISLSNQTIIGDEHNILKGSAFSEPVENHTIKSSDWVNRPIIYSEDIGEVDLAVSLDQQIYDLLLPSIQQFAISRQIEVAVNKGTCGITSRQLSNKTTDIGGYCCPPGSSDRLPGLNFHTLGISSIALLVHPGNPVNSLATEHARDIFRGHIRDWSDLPDSNNTAANIEVTTRLHCKSRPGHWKLINAEERVFSPYIKDLPDIALMLNHISANRTALGYETLHMIEREKKPVKILRINDIHPSNLDALGKGYYPFYRVFNMTTWDGAGSKKLATELINHLQQEIESRSAELKLVPASHLKKNGWGFTESELTSEPLSET